MSNTNDTNDTNKNIAKKFLKALGSGDIATLQSVLSEDAIATTAGYSKVSGQRNFQVMTAIAGAMPKITKGGIDFEIINITAEEDRVAVEVQGHSTMVGGEEYNNQYHFLFFIRDGKIWKLKEYLDNQLADQVLGPYLAAA